MTVQPAAQAAAAAKVTGAAPVTGAVPAPRGSSLGGPLGSPATTALVDAKPAVQAFRGGIVHSLALGQLQVLEDGLLTVGRVFFFKT